MNELETRDKSPAKGRDDVGIFLGKHTEKLRAGGGPGYNLIDEYRKTKGNVSLLVPLSIIAVVAVFVGASWFVTSSINDQSRKVSVNIQSFEDLNLKDLLDEAKNTANKLAVASNELAALEYEQNAALARVRDERAAALKLIDGLSPAEQKKRRAAIESNAAAKEAAVKAKYRSAIDEKRKSVVALQERAAAYDTRNLETAKKQQQAMDNQQQLFAMEKKNLSDGYEKRLIAAAAALKTEKSTSAERLTNTVSELTARYNPTWTDERGLALSAADAKAPRAPAFRAYDKVPAASPVSLDELKETAARYEELRGVIGRLRDVPYKNSVPGALASADAYAAALAKNYQNLEERASAQLRDREARIADLETRVDSYAYALSGMSRDENEAGFVLDGRNPDRVVVYVDPLFRVADGTTAWVFRTVDQQIAELRLRREGAGFVGKLERMEKGQSLRPFDKILLQLTDKANSGEQ